MQTAAGSEHTQVHDLVPGFDLGAVIGRGGFAVVHYATQRSTGRAVAVKIDSRPR